MNHERALLGAILSGAAVPVDLPITGRDFDSPHHETIYDACERVHAAGGRPTALAVFTAMGADAHRLPEGAGYLHTLVAEWAADDPAWLAEQVAAQAARRRLDSAALSIHQLATDPAGDAAEINERARQLVDDATASTEPTGARRAGEVVLQVIEAAEVGRNPALSTPWPDLDRHIHGIMPGRLVVIGARPGAGKSIAAAQIAAHVAKRHGLGAHLATLEMSAAEVMQRVLSAEADVALSKIEFGRDLRDSDWRRIATANAAISEWPLFIDDTPAQSVATIRAAVRARQRTTPVAVVCVDYLGLLTPQDRRVDRHLQIGAMTAALKLMARELDTCVVLCAQLNRASLARRDSRPNLGDLRESGAIEQDADAVVLLHRPNRDQPLVEVLIEKVRNGPIGECELSMQGHMARLRSTATTYVPETA